MRTSKPPSAALAFAGSGSSYRVHTFWAFWLDAFQARLVRQHFQLLYRSRTPHIRRYQRGMPRPSGEPLPQLRARRRLPRTGKSGHQDDGRPSAIDVDGTLGVTEQMNHFVPHDSENLLRRGERRQNILADSLFPHARDEVTDDPEVHIGLEKRHPQLFERSVYVRFGELDFSTECLDNSLKPRRDLLKHGQASGAA